MIVASGYGDLPNHPALRNDPHIRFMSKPYDIGALTTALRALVRADERNGVRRRYYSGTTAVASISTFAPCSTSAATCTTDIGG